MGLPLLLRGKYLSHTERPATILSASQTPDPLFPLSRLGDGRPSQLFMFPSRLEDDWWQADINQYLNGGFENWTAGEPNDHTVNLTGTATIVEETVSPIFEGGSSMELNNGASGTIEVLQSIEALAGEVIEFRYVAQTSNADSPATLEIFNPYTRKWLTTAGAWSSKRQNAIEEAGTAFPSVLDVLTFTVEPFSTIRNHIVELEVRYHMDGATATRTHHWDAVEWVPETNFTSIHAHNLSPNIVPRLVWADEDLEVVPVDAAFRFDGTDYITRSTDFDTLADSKVGTLAFRFRVTGGDGTFRLIINNPGDRFFVWLSSSNILQAGLKNSAGATILSLSSTTTYLAGDGWHDAILDWDLAAGSRHMIVDGASVLGGSSTVNDFADYTNGGWAIGAKTTGASPWIGDLAELWFDDVYLDASLAATVALFRKASGGSVYLGPNGELVTGSAPALYWRGDTALTNLGYGGDFDGITGDPEAVINMIELTKQDIAFYEKLTSSVNARYWKMHLRGLNAVDAIETGLWVIGPAITPAWSPRLGLSEVRRIAQSVAVVESSGEQWRTRRAKLPRRSASLSFRLKSVQQAAFRDELLARTAQGSEPIVLVENQATTKVVHGRIPPESEFIFQSFEAEEVDMVVEESSNGIGLQA